MVFFGMPQVRRELPVEAGATAASRSTVGAASLAAARRSSDAGDELTPVFDIARIDPTGEAVIAGRAAPSASVELLRNGYVHDRAVADRSGQFVMVPPRLPPGDYELTLRSRQPDGKEATSKRSVVVTLQTKMVEAPMTLDKQEAGIAVSRKSSKCPRRSIRRKPLSLSSRKSSKPMCSMSGRYRRLPAVISPPRCGCSSRLPNTATRPRSATSASCSTGARRPELPRSDEVVSARGLTRRRVRSPTSASCTTKGQGTAQDYGEAMKWNRMAAEQRNAEAQFNLGVMYQEGRGVA